MDQPCGSSPFRGAGRLLAIGAALLTVAVASAGEVQARFTAGVTTFADDGSVNHATFGGSGRFYFSRRWAVEPEFLYMRHDSFVRDRDYVLWGNISADLRDRGRRLVPYWFGAPGVIHHRSTFGQTTFGNTETAGATGAGLRFQLSDRVFVSPQFRVGLADGIFAEVTGSLGIILSK